MALSRPALGTAPRGNDVGDPVTLTALSSCSPRGFLGRVHGCFTPSPLEVLVSLAIPVCLPPRHPHALLAGRCPTGKGLGSWVPTWRARPPVGPASPLPSVQPTQAGQPSQHRLPTRAALIQSRVTPERGRAGSPMKSGLEVAAPCDLPGSRRHTHFLGGGWAGAQGPKPSQTSFHLGSESAPPLPAVASFVHSASPDTEGVLSCRPPMQGSPGSPPLDSVPAKPREAGRAQPAPAPTPTARRFPVLEPSPLALGTDHVLPVMGGSGSRAREQSREPSAPPSIPGLLRRPPSLATQGPGAGQEQGQREPVGQLCRGVLRLTSAGFGFPSLEAQGLEAQVSRRHPPLLWCWQ